MTWCGACPPQPAAPRLLRSAVRSLGPPSRDAESLSREQALLYLFALHDHDRSGRLDGLELLELLGAVLERRDGGRPDAQAVAALVDRTLERQDLSGDGLLDPPELLLSPGRGPPGQPLLQHPGEPGAGAAPRGDAGGHMGSSSLAEGQGVPGGGAHPEGEAAPQAENMKVEEAPEAEAPEAEGPDGEAIEVEEAPETETPEAGAPESETPEAGAPEGETATVWGDPGEE
ncbi:PREDICTED: cell growth regulator with EF hand domain protein 1 [Calidris pugnax]|uniref:cell growth regulator with EF hand domain protein 1 n=1 Tax=Calidris pugnax TaxID=198806 RepID=UPI00071E0C43|nr:PREDICTED: cell growth regulator with EF hand domain protein 1 [Calidris pugnax]